MNKRNPYIKISIDEKNKAIDGAAIQKKKESADVDINKYLKQKISSIQGEIGKFTHNVSKFANTCDEELTKLIDNLDEGQLAMAVVKTSNEDRK